MDARQPRYDALDAWRGVAALLIAVAHGWVVQGFSSHDTLAYRLVDGARYAVGWFFALSGFVVFLPFARAAIAGTAPPSPLAFLLRRAARLVPLYAVVLLGAWLIGNGGNLALLGDLGEHLLFVNVYAPEHYFGLLVAPGWSLAFEVAYYLLVAVLGSPLVAICSRFASRQLRAGVLLAAIAALGAWGMIAKLTTPTRWGDWPAHLSPVDALDSFALGMALAVCCATGIGTRALTNRAARLVGCALLALPSGLSLAGLPSARWGYLWAAAGFALLAAPTVLASGAGPGPRAQRLCATLGSLSYGTYLWHRPLMEFAQRTGTGFVPGGLPLPADTAIAVAASATLAALTYRTIEQPAMRIARRLTDRPRPAFGTRTHQANSVTCTRSTSP